MHKLLARQMKRVLGVEEQQLGDVFKEMAQLVGCCLPPVGEGAQWNAEFY
jgi:RNA-binding protein YlmH